MDGLTVFVPVKNMQDTLPRALDSVLSQTVKNYKIVVGVDPESTDNSEDIAKKYGTIVIKSDNPGLGGVLRLWRSHRMPYNLVGQLDADDELKPQAVESMLSIFDKNLDVGLAWSRHIKHPQGTIGCSKPLPEGKTLLEAMVEGWWGASHFRVFRQTVYLTAPYKLHKAVTPASDQVFVMCMSLTGCKCGFLPQILYVYHTEGLNRISIQSKFWSVSKKWKRRYLRYLKNYVKTLQRG
jgi:glycosyltransferase involved in cell wall biosynthesis